MNTKVSLLLTGSELMNGDVIDTNSVIFAQQLSDIGLAINKKVTIGDDPQLLALEITRLSEGSELLIINGGLGPTVDDLTAAVLATTCNVELKLHSQAHQHLKKWASKRKTKLNAPNLKQAYLPQYCDIIANKTGSAVGISIVLNECLILCTPGVPSELTHMLKEEILPQLKKRFPCSDYAETHRLHTFGIGESNLQALINNKLPDWPTEIEIGFRAAMPLLELKLITKCQIGREKLILWMMKLKALLGDHIVASGQNKHVTLADHLVPMLINAKQKITVAESCTGGLIASQIAAVSGASAIFEAGFVTYSNNMKTKMLAVPEAILTEYGAVSEETVIAMAQGALKHSCADFTIAVSGIAGPNGGSKDKPVGSVWIAWGDKQQISAKYYYISAERKHFQQIIAARSLDLIRRMLIKSTQIAYYHKKTDEDKALK